MYPRRLVCYFYNKMIYFKEKYVTYMKHLTSEIIFYVLKPGLGNYTTINYSALK